MLGLLGQSCPAIFCSTCSNLVLCPCVTCIESKISANILQGHLLNTFYYRFSLKRANYMQPITIYLFTCYRYVTRRTFSGAQRTALAIVIVKHININYESSQSNLMGFQCGTVRAKSPAAVVAAGNCPSEAAVGFMCCLEACNTTS